MIVLRTETLTDTIQHHFKRGEIYFPSFFLSLQNRPLPPPYHFQDKIRKDRTWDILVLYGLDE